MKVFRHDLPCMHILHSTDGTILFETTKNTLSHPLEVSEHTRLAPLLEAFILSRTHLPLDKVHNHGHCRRQSSTQ